MRLLRQPGALPVRDVLASLPVQRCHSITYAAATPDGTCALHCSCGCTDAGDCWNDALDALLDHRLFHAIVEGVA